MAEDESAAVAAPGHIYGTDGAAASGVIGTSVYIAPEIEKVHSKPFLSSAIGTMSQSGGNPSANLDSLRTVWLLRSPLVQRWPEYFDTHLQLPLTGLGNL